jgi:hypothetical protein
MRQVGPGLAWLITGRPFEVTMYSPIASSLAAVTFHSGPGKRYDSIGSDPAHERATWMRTRPRRVTADRAV